MTLRNAVENLVKDCGNASVCDRFISFPRARGLAQELDLSCFYDNRTGRYVFQNRTLHPVTLEEKEATVWRNA